MSAFEADRFNHSRTSPHWDNQVVCRNLVDGAFGPSLRSRPQPGSISTTHAPFRVGTLKLFAVISWTGRSVLRCAHARNPAQFQPLMHLSAPYGLNRHSERLDHSKRMIFTVEELAFTFCFGKS